MKNLLSAVLLLCVALGCGSENVPSGAVKGGGGAGGSSSSLWMGIPSVTKDVIVWINAGTNWVLNKNQVSVSKVSDVRPGSTEDSTVADFKIVVTNGLNTFDTVATDVPCDAKGIPTEESVDTIRTAVEDIKDKIRRLQN